MFIQVLCQFLIWYFSSYRILRVFKSIFAYKSFIKYVICKHFLPAYDLSFSLVSFEIMCILLLDEVFYSCQLDPVYRWCCWFSGCWIWQLLAEGILKSPDAILGLSISPCSSITFWHFAVRSITIRIVILLWGNWPLYHFVILLYFIPENFPCSEVYPA
jgi:hypothetical protein